MKKIYKTILLSFALLFSGNLFAVTHNITVANFAFAPNTLTVTVGDTIVFTWISGGHTTTSTSVPSGAVSWGHNIASANDSFVYPITMVGTYSYHCAIHPSMTGTITAITNGISSPELKSNFHFNSLGSSAYEASFSLSKPSTNSLSIFDITGKTVKVLISGAKSAGTFSEVFNLEDLQKGIYLIDMNAENQRIVRRVIIE